MSRAKSAPAILPETASEDRRREAILTAAFTLLVQRGYARTSTLDIATRAKVSKRELYQLFDGKEAILAACIVSRVERMRRPLALPQPQDRPTFVAALMGFGRTFLQEISRPAVVAVYRLAATEAERSPEVARTLDANGRAANRTALIDLLVHAQSCGILRGGDAEAMASQFFGLLLGDLLLRLVLRVARPPTPDEVERRAHAATDALLQLHGETRRPS